jgi:hypothetical protein
MKGMRNGATLAYSEVLSKHLPGGTEEKKRKNLKIAGVPAEI